MGSERTVIRNKVICPHCRERQYDIDIDIDEMLEDKPYETVCISCELKFVVILCKRDYWFHTSKGTA